MPDKEKKQGVLRALSFSSQIGITMAACVFIGVFLGKLIDDFLGTSPWFILIFSLLGVAAAFRAIFHMAKKKEPPVKDKK